MSVSALQRTLAAIEKRKKPVNLNLIQSQYRKAIMGYLEEPNVLQYLADRVTPYLGATQAFLELLRGTCVDPLLLESLFFTRIVGMITEAEMRQVVVTLKDRRPDVYNIICWRSIGLVNFFENAENIVTPDTSTAVN